MIIHKSIPTSTSIEFINVEPQSPLVSKGVAKVLYLGRNRNGSYFTKDVVNRMIPSLYGIPIVGKFEKSMGDFLGHEKMTRMGRDGRAQLIPLTVPYGYVPDNAKVWFQKFMDDDSIEREYLCCDVKLWTGRYPEAFRVVTKGNHQSMEIDPETMDGDWARDDKDESEYFMVSEAYFSALCILGEDVEPCFEGAGIAHEFSLTKEDMTFLVELDKSIENMKGEYNMKIEDLKLMLEAGSGEPDVTHSENFPANGVTPADNVVTPEEGLATDPNFAGEFPPVKKEEEQPEGEPKPAEAPINPEGEQPQEPKSEDEPKPAEGEQPKGEFPPVAQGEEPKKPEGDNVAKEGEEKPPVGLPAEEPQIPGLEDPNVPDATNTSPVQGFDPAAKIDQIMSEDKDILETEMLKKIIELLEGRMGGMSIPMDNTAMPNAQINPETNVAQAAPMAPIPQPQPQMPTEVVTPEVAQIRRQFEVEIADRQAKYEALEAKHEALLGEFTKLQDFKLQIEMNDKELIIGEYSMLPQSVLDDLREKAKSLSKEDLEAKCALALVRSSKREKKDNNMISYSYGQAPQNDFLKDLEDAISKTNK